MNNNMKTFIKSLFSVCLIIISFCNLTYANVDSYKNDFDYNPLVFNLTVDKEILLDDNLNNINFYDSTINIFVINISTLDYHYFQHINPFYTYRLFNLEFDTGLNLLILVETPLPSAGSIIMVCIIILLILK